MSRPIPIFYEDDWGAVKEFGLHELLVSSIADAKKVDYWTLRPRFEAIPNNAAADCLKESRPAKNKLLRDRLLLKVARLPSPDGRDCVRRKVPSFDECVNAIASAT
ncbi:hypothetical protein PPSIR1_26303 [Plesiocystis pacifica SIR-1]|uniref:Uncharacterized protein n=1 Tax=Plesiocystis pacifica SIR-1 TaxID=391625 RepID=A6G9X1_9BACT|nr:hypothetical protein [Plesiocystis pacifica]EDM77296.1 hypothetical protein PPSIR1_26303 [Plesiocystis pacifica SIR-1]